MKDLEALVEKYYVPPSKQIKAVYVWEGSANPTSPKHWRNRTGWKSILKETGHEVKDGMLVDAGSGSMGLICGIPLIVSASMLPMKVLILMGDGTVMALDEPSETVEVKE